MNTKNIIKKESSPKLGILEWFRPGEYAEVEQALKDLNDLGITHLRTGISWADWYTEGAAEWYDWLFKKLSAQVEVLPCFHYTPPSLGIVSKTSSPPKYLKSFADFIDVMITRYGEYFDWVELWNEPNNPVEYDFTHDYSWNKFCQMIDMAAYWAKHRGKKTLLGGMSPIDPNWLQLMAERGTLENIDAVGIHGFPDVFDQQWMGWGDKVKEVRKVLERFDLQKEVWISEVGFSTWQHDEVKQYEEFKNVLNADVDRIYWYSLKDLDPALATVGGYHLDEREYHFGMKTASGDKKLLYRLLQKKGVGNIFNHTYIQKNYHPEKGENYILITGGAGFVGTNLASRFLEAGKRVMIYDNLSRDGVIENLNWLKETYPKNLIVQIADIRESELLERFVKNATAVYHFSAQVAVTTSLTDPKMDFDVNLRGTFNIVEAIRKAPHRPPLIFTSTNKVYGNLGDMEFSLNGTRYEAVDPMIRKNGISEKQPLDFHSPYGCSKGAADQYVLDYCKSYGIKSVVFRMSCIYGPHQFGNEDQGWVAHFLISAIKDKPVSIYGNGKQVRDILYVEDLVDAFLLALKNMDTLAGNVFNIGGGPENTVSIKEILEKIKEIANDHLEISYGEWRRGDQYYYVSDTSKFKEATGWSPKYSVTEGVNNLLEWLRKNRDMKAKKLNGTTKTKMAIHD